MNKIILELRSINFKYEKKTSNVSFNQDKVLDNISLSVRQAEIYGLLGASGCGKTTLLRLILGQLSPLSGKIRLFGQSIDCKHKPSPQNIGYMPQDIVLYHEFTPIEILLYFGSLYKMPPSYLSKRIDQLLKLLELDDNLNSEKLIRYLSGGQRRRVSLAIALLHEPRLLILDEPTVGVDPILREVIWSHLNYLTKERRNTVILTTHYIEESRFAQMIGFIRHGRLLVQAEPETLLKRYAANTMEEIFLQMCRENDSWEEKKVIKRKQTGLNSLSSGYVRSTTTLVTNNSDLSTKLMDNSIGKSSQRKYFLEKFNQAKVTMNSLIANLSTNMLKEKNSDNTIHPTTYLEMKQRPKGTQNRPSNHFICWSHLWTLMQKNFRQVYRNSSLLLFFILLPAIEMALIMLCIGRDINHIPIAVFNGEKPRPDLSQLFLDSFQQDAFIVHHFDSSQEAYEAVKLNQAAAVLQFSERFSTALRSRFFSFGFIDDEINSSEIISIWNDSSIYVQLDMSNQLIGLQIQRQLLTAFLNFAQRLAVSLGLSNHTFKPPISFGPPVYGVQTSAVVETFIAPGALIMIAFFATTIVTCHLLIHEIRQELIGRALIAGATTAEFIFSHIVIQSTILMIQLCLVFLTAFRLFHIPYLGSLSLSIALICLQGFCGLMYGFMLSATCPDEIYATTLAIGTFFPSVIIGGIFWPVQSMPTILQYLSQCLPSTQSIDALRFILLRDWDLRQRSVASAFVVSTLWLLVFLFCALRNFKKRI